MSKYITVCLLFIICMQQLILWRTPNTFVAHLFLWRTCYVRHRYITDKCLPSSPIFLWRVKNTFRGALYSVAHIRTCATEIFLWCIMGRAPQKHEISVAHIQVRHRMHIFVARILWRTHHAPQNAKMVRH